MYALYAEQNIQQAAKFLSKVSAKYDSISFTLSCYYVKATKQITYQPIQFFHIILEQTYDSVSNKLEICFPSKY